jgi:hypothetical protein
MPTATPITNCRLCASPGLAKVLELAPTPAGDHYLPKDRHPETLPVFPLELQLCPKCGHVQLGAVVDPAYLYREYIYTTSSSLGLADHFAKYAASTVAKLGLKPGELVVEIGSNDGTMLRAFQNLGMNVLGVDPAKDIAQRASDSGISTLPEFFSTSVAKRILSEKGPTSLVIANNVMANVGDVRETALAVRHLLADHGVFVFETGYLKYLAEDVVFDNIYHEHIDYYSVRPLRDFFQSLEMKLFDVEESPSKGSSIRCFVGLSNSSRESSQTVENLCSREKEFGYHTPRPYQHLGKLLERTKNEIHHFLGRHPGSRGRVVGFGASVGATTVLYQFGLGGSLSKLLDDNPNRSGLFSPGLALPVVLAKTEFENDPPDIVILLAWRYGEKILERHGNNRSKGVQFLQFFPDVSVVGT